MPSRTTPAARGPAFFAVRTLFLSVSNLSCRLSFLLSFDTLLDLNLHLMFFDLRNPSLQSTWLLQRSVYCVLLLLLLLCHTLSELGIFLFLNFSFLFNLDLVFSCFLGNLQFLFCCHASMTFSILVSRHRSNFFETLFSSCASACRSHCYFCYFDSILLLGMTFSPAVGFALLTCCGLCSSFLLWAVLFAS